MEAVRKPKFKSEAELAYQNENVRAWNQVMIELIRGAEHVVWAGMVRAGVKVGEDVLTSTVTMTNGRVFEVQIREVV